MNIRFNLETPLLFVFIIETVEKFGEFIENITHIHFLVKILITYLTKICYCKNNVGELFVSAYAIMQQYNRHFRLYKFYCFH